MSPFLQCQIDSTGSQVVTFLEGVKRCRFDLVFGGPFQEGCALTDVNHTKSQRTAKSWDTPNHYMISDSFPSADDPEITAYCPQFVDVRLYSF